MKSLQNVQNIVSEIFQEAGVQIGEDSKVEFGKNNTYVTTGWVQADIELDKRVKTVNQTGGGWITQRITLQDGEKLEAWCSSEFDEAGNSQIGYNDFMIDHEIHWLDVTGVESPTQESGTYDEILYDDGGWNAPEDAWSDGSSYLNNSGGPLEIQVLFCYYSASNGDTVGYQGQTSYLYLSKTNSPLDVIPPEIDVEYFAGISSSVNSEGNSLAMGIGTISKWEGSVALGSYNKGDDYNNVMEIGDGTSDLERSNIFELTKSGELILPNNIIIDPNSVTTKKYVGIIADKLHTKVSKLVQPEFLYNKISASDGAQGDYFGYSVSVSDTKILVGAYGDDDNGSISGSVYVYNLDGTNELKITASDGAQDDDFGYSVAISDTNILVGAYRDDDNGSSSGSVYVYNLDGTNEIKITASDGEASDVFGYSVAISDTKIFVGAHGDDDNGSYSGSVYVYNLDGTNEIKITASDGAVADYFGYSVAVSDTKILVGAYGDDDDKGSVYVYNLDGTNEIKITASDGVLNDNFGRSVAISDTNILVGAYGDDDNGSSSGSVYVYDIDGTNEVKITALDGAVADYFGRSVAISDTKIFVGAQYDNDNDNGSNSGSVYVYDIDGTNEVKITALDGAQDDVFGRSVAISDTKIFVGADGDDDNGSDSGSVYIYDLPLVPKISSTDIVYNNEQFDTVLKNIFDDNDNVAIAAKGVVAAFPDTDNLYDELFYETINSSESQIIQTDIITYDGQNFGYSMDSTNNKLLVGATGDKDHGTQAGAAYLYDADGTTGIKILGSGAGAGDFFGLSVAMSNDYFIVGGPGWDGSGADNVGAAWIYNIDGTYITRISSPRNTADNRFGTSVAINDTKILVGSIQAYGNSGVRGPGFASVFTPSGTHEFTIDGTGTNDARFGHAVAMNNTKMVISEIGDGAGSIYIYDLDGTNKITISPSELSAGDAFGYSLSISDTKIAVGTTAGIMYIYDLDGSNEIVYTPITPNGSFGKKVSISNEILLVNGGLLDSEYVVYVFNLNTGDTTIVTPLSSTTSNNFSSDLSVNDTTIFIGDYRDSLSGYDSGTIYKYINESSNPLSIHQQVAVTTSNTYTDKAILSITEETSLAIYTPDFDNNYLEYTLTEETTLNNPINPKKGQKGDIVIKQDVTGGWNTTFGTNYIFAVAPTLNTTANAYNVFKYTVIEVDKVLMEFVADFV